MTDATEHEPMDLPEAGNATGLDSATDFGIVARWQLLGAAMRDEHVSPSSRGVLWAILDRLGKDGQCYPSLETIAEDANVARRTVCRAIDELTGAGYLIRLSGWKHKANRYSMGRCPEFKGVTELSPLGSDEAVTPGVTKPSPLSARVVPEGVTRLAHRSDKAGTQGVTGMAPEPAFLNLLQEPVSEEQELLPAAADAASSSPDAGKPAPATPATRLDARVAQLTEDAIAAFNARLGRPHGLLASVHRTMGREERRKQVRRVATLAGQAAEAATGAKVVTPEFWRGYFEECARDPWLRGDGPYLPPHEDWRPDFEYLTRKDVMLKVVERARNEAEQDAASDDGRHMAGAA